jgi:hypothetical protein
MGDLAALENRRMDALTFYQNAMLARGKDSQPDNLGRDELAEKTRSLWKELGGGNEAWQAWLNRARELFGQIAPDTTGMTWTKMDKPMPDFELADMKGAKWRLANLKGKTTLINLWSTG